MVRPLFGSVFLAGFECATQVRSDGVRLDSIAATRHDLWCEEDYGAAVLHGLHGARDGFRWHLIGRTPGEYDWSSVRPMLEAARRRNLRVIWDLCHYGLPDWLDIWSDDFYVEFAEYTRHAVRLIREVSRQRPMICPLNEISFWAWIGGTEGKIYPHCLDRADELKKRLVRAKLASIAAAREVDPETLVISAEPLINIFRDTEDEADIQAAMAYHQSQYQAMDWLLGHAEHQLGGRNDAVDLMGVNFYPHNQWRIRGGFVPLGHHDYRPFSELLGEIHQRYGKPLLIAETGAENSARAVWLSYVCQEVRAALKNGVPIVGITIYPIAEYPGWDNERTCQVGLFCSADEEGRRRVHLPLWEEMQKQARLFGEDAGLDGHAYLGSTEAA